MSCTVLVLAALGATALAGCGSNGSVSGGDAAADALPDVRPDTRHDARAADAVSDARPEAAATSTCTPAELGRGCVSGPCTVTGPSDALPAGATVTVSATSVPAGLSGDVLGTSLCTLKVTGAAAASDLTLSIAEASPPASSVLFQYDSSTLSQLVVTSQPEASAVSGLVVAPGVYGATQRPAQWSSVGTAGIDVSASGDAASLLRNLSGQQTYGAFYDGTHLFVCNGPRLLIYNALPANPTVLPDVVLGEPDIDTLTTPAITSSYGGCLAVWSDGTRIVALQSARIGIWNSVPTTNFTPADLELGQPDFSTNTPNNGGVSSSSLNAGAWAVDSDGTQLAVADRFNNRVLVWKTFPTEVDQPADFVVGQPAFATNAAAQGAVPLYQPEGVLFTSTGLLVDGYFGPGVVHVPTVTSNNPSSDGTLLPYVPGSLASPGTLLLGGSMAAGAANTLLVRDYRRVVVAGIPGSGPAPVKFVLGEPDPTRIVTSPTSASVVETVPSPAGYVEQGMGAGALGLIPDLDRLLIFDEPPAYNFAPASRVFGQAGFTTNGQVDYRGISASTLAGPADVAVSGSTLAVADGGNNRVLLFNTSSIAGANAAAASVVGQSDMSSYLPNVNQTTPSATTLSGPAGVALDGSHLIVADTENHRVLIWNAVPTTNGVAADIVLGQTSFSVRSPNHGNGDANADGFCDADGSGFFYPTGVASDGQHLFVSDRQNNRVLVWNSFPTASGQAADGVIGQPDFTTVQSNGGQGGSVVLAGGFNLPTGIFLSSTSLYVADSENNRVVRWDSVTTTPTPGAFLGQASGTVVANPNYWPATGAEPGYPTTPPGTSSVSVVHPRAVAVANGEVYVSEIDSNRVHFFDVSNLAPRGELGQTSDTAGTANASGVTAGSISAPWGLASDGNTLWVADSADHRVLGFPVGTVPTTGALATAVIGQASFLTSGFNQTSTAANGVTLHPRGMAVTGNELYVADTGNNRVSVFQTPVTAGQPPARTIGQPSGSLALANSGGAISSRSLAVPQGVYADATRVIVADTGNNRVLVYGPSGTSATLVLGQSGYTTATVPSTPSASSMNGPTGVFTDGTSVWVADTGNHRVLVWNTFPTANGQPADAVLGQTSFAGDLSNQGGSTASASTLSFPADVLSVGGVLYVADSGNNRVVFFLTPPSTSGTSAGGVLGQANLTSRLAAAAPNDLNQLAGPVKLATDGENLYVADRDLGRVAAWALGSASTAAPATRVIGAVGGLAIQSPGGVAATRTPYFTSQLYIADTAGSRIDVVGSVSRLTGD